MNLAELVDYFEGVTRKVTPLRSVGFQTFEPTVDRTLCIANRQQQHLCCAKADSGALVLKLHLPVYSSCDIVCFNQKGRTRFSLVESEYALKRLEGI